MDTAGDLAGRCPRCAAPHEPYQEYCLECGARLPPIAPPPRREAWSRSSPSWFWAAIGALVLVAAVAGAIVAAAATEEDEGTRTRVAPVTEARPETTDVITGEGTVTVPAPTAAEGETKAPPEEPPDAADGGGGIRSWPSGKKGFTIVLASVATGAGRGPAERAAGRARERGLADVGVLTSSNFSSLRPGYFVAFAGVFDTLGGAEASLAEVRSSGFPVAYVREIAP